MAPAQYWHDPLRAEEYKKHSKYLAILNNQIDNKDSQMKENLSKLENFVMIKWANDTFVKPRVKEMNGMSEIRKNIFLRNLLISSSISQMTPKEYRI